MRYVSKIYKKKISRLYQIARQNDLPLPFVINCLKGKSELKSVRPYKRRTKKGMKHRNAPKLV